MQDRTSEPQAAPVGEAEFNAMLEKLTPEIYTLTFNDEWDVNVAWDITQQAILQAIENRDQLSDIDKMRAWLNTIRRRVRIHIGKAAKREEEQNEKYYNDTGAEGKTMTNQPESRIEEFEERKKEAKLLKEGYLSLPLSLREVFSRYYRLGMSKEEIAEELEISVKTVDNRLGRIKNRLSEYIRRMIVAYMAFEFSGIDTKAVAAQLFRETILMHSGGQAAANTTIATTTGGASSVAAKSTGFSIFTALTFVGMAFAYGFSLILGGRIFGESVVRSAPTLVLRRWLIRRFILCHLGIMSLPLIYASNWLIFSVILNRPDSFFINNVFFSELLVLGGVTVFFMACTIVSYFVQRNTPENNADGGIASLRKWVSRGSMISRVTVSTTLALWGLMLVIPNILTLTQPWINPVKFCFILGSTAIFSIILIIIHRGQTSCLQKLLKLADDPASLPAKSSSPEKTKGKWFEELGFILPFAAFQLLLNFNHIFNIRSHPVFSGVEIVVWSIGWGLVYRWNLKDTGLRWPRIFIWFVIQLSIIALLRFTIYE